ncbi:MAG: tRNA/rRNA methyltransferase [Rheinheimera sp.]|nr:MAG: tRNA/rRNA methyltransferase [Rheinheimera sp.]
MKTVTVTEHKYSETVQTAQTARQLTAADDKLKSFFDTARFCAKLSAFPGCRPASDRTDIVAYPPKKPASSARPPRSRDSEPSLLEKPWKGKASAASAKTVKPRADKPQQQPAAPRQSQPLSAAQLKQQGQQESRVLGENACRVCFTQRPDAVIKMYLHADYAPRFADVMKYLAAHKRAYHIVDNAELEKISGSQHHGGVVLVVKKRESMSIASYLTLHRKKTQDCLLALDGVGNPHNLGAIARSCAHFGVSGIILSAPEALQSGAAARTAEGGLEFVEALQTDHLPLALKLCKEAGYTLITTSSHAGVSLYQSKLPKKVVVVFGEEMQGVSKAVANSAEIALQIPGTGKVESLNVSVAASLILGEWYRQQQ